jgi:hypothetical protein
MEVVLKHWLLLLEAPSMNADSVPGTISSTEYSSSSWTFPDSSIDRDLVLILCMTRLLTTLRFTTVPSFKVVSTSSTIHRISRVRRHSLKHIHRSLKSESDETPIFEGDVHVPGTTREDIVEIFEEPATVVKDVEEVETTFKHCKGINKT